MRQLDKWVQAALGALEWVRDERSVSLDVCAYLSHCTSPLTALLGLWLALSSDQELCAKMASLCIVTCTGITEHGLFLPACLPAWP